MPSARLLELESTRNLLNYEGVLKARDRITGKLDINIEAIMMVERCASCCQAQVIDKIQLQ
jgi:hypothetical protein